MSFGEFAAAVTTVERTAAASAKVLAPYFMAVRLVTRSVRSGLLVVIGDPSQRYDSRSNARNEIRCRRSVASPPEWGTWAEAFDRSAPNSAALRVHGSIPREKAPSSTCGAPAGEGGRNKCAACGTQAREEGASAMSLSVGSTLAYAQRAYCWTMLKIASARCGGEPRQIASALSVAAKPPTSFLYLVPEAVAHPSR
jgi:hypothetical protein